MDKSKPKIVQSSKDGLALHLQPARDAAAKLRADVIEMADDVFDRYVWGESFQAIAESLPFKIPAWKLRQILMMSEETRDQYSMCGIERAHNLVDAALDYGRTAAALGDAAGLRIAVDVNLKVASKLHSAAYGDKAKLEVTGRMEVKADLKLTAEQAYEKMIKG